MALATAARPPLRLLASLFVVTIALRPQIVGLGPLLPRIQEDLGTSHAAVGLLTTIPVILMGLLAPIGPVIAARVGARLALAGCVAGIAGFGLLRSVAPGAGGLLVTTVGLGLAMGIAGALMSILVKERAPSLPAMATGAYATGIVAGSFAAAALAVPLALVLGGWRAVMAAFAIAAVGSLLAWLVGTEPDRRSAGTRQVAVALPWRSPLAWGLAAVFGLQSLIYYGTISWLPGVYVERGWSEISAGSLIAVMHLVGLIAGIAVPFAAERLGSRRSQMTAMGATALAALIGIQLAPAGAWAWAALLGFALGGIFPLCLTLPVDVAHGPRQVGAAAALMLLGGYLLSGLGPIALGFARDATGDYAVSIWILVGLSGLLVLACLALTPARLARGIRVGGAALPEAAGG